MLGKEKRGTILIETILFVILNFIFLAILVVFLLRYSSGTHLLEEQYSKQIALMIDSAKPGMEIYLNMEDALETAEEKWGKEKLGDIVKIVENKVIVRLSEESEKGYSYSFFNNIDISGYYYNQEKGYVFKIGEYK